MFQALAIQVLVIYMYLLQYTAVYPSPCASFISKGLLHQYDSVFVMLMTQLIGL